MESLRRADLQADAEALRRIDTTFVSGSTYVVEVHDDGIAIRRTALAGEVTQRLPFDAEDLDGCDAWVATVGGRVVGLAAWHLERWNRRAVLDHLYVDAPSRRRGVARRLVEHVASEATEAGASMLWVETPNVNAPAVDAYRRLGFELSGFDRTLYFGTPAEGDVALFLARRL